MKKYLNKFLILIGILLMFTTPVSAASKPAYTAVPMANENKTMTYQVYKVDWGKNPDEAWGRMLFGDSFNSLSEYRDSNELAQLTYPSLQWGSLLSSSARDSDNDIANEVMSLVANNMNTVVGFVEKWSQYGIDINSDKSGPLTVSDFYNELSGLFSSNGESVDINGSSFRLVPISTAEDKQTVQKIISSNKAYTGATEANFRKLYAPMVDNRYDSGNGVIVAIEIPHGYYDQQAYSNRQLSDAKYNDEAKFVKLSEIAKFIANNDKNNLEFGNFYTKTSIESNFDTMFGMLNTWILDLLGFDDPAKLVFNTGDRAQNYYLGMMPLQWWNVANLLFWGFEIIAIVMLFGSVIAMILRQNLATVSPTIRNTIKDSIASLIMSIFMLMAYAPIFYVLGKVNMMLVEVFASFSTSGVVLSDTNIFATGISWIIKLLLFFVNAGIIIKINIDYFTRAVMITVLHVIAPVAIASLAYKQPGSRGLFNSWLKELTGCIFMQSFNALLLAIMFSLLRGSSSQWWHTQAALFMLCSLNGWFKQLFGFSDSVNQIAGSVQSQAKNATAQALDNAGTLVNVGASMAGAGMGGAATGGSVGSTVSNMAAEAYRGAGGTPVRSGNAGYQNPSRQDTKTYGDTGKGKTAKVDEKEKPVNGNDRQTGGGNRDNVLGEDTSSTKRTSETPQKLGSVARNIGTTAVYGTATLGKVAMHGLNNALGVREQNKKEGTQDNFDIFVNTTASKVGNVAEDIDNKIERRFSKGRDPLDQK